MLKNFKLFESWLNETWGKNDTDWEAMLAIAKKRRSSATASTSRKFGLSDDNPYEKLLGEVWKRITNSSIYGLKVPSYPFVLAISSTGDDYGNDNAWLIKSQEDFFRWIFTQSASNKMFPDLSGEGYSDFREDISEEEVEDLLECLDKDSDYDDYTNGYVVEFFQNEEAMKERARETHACQDCDGSGESEEGEECENCEGMGKIDPETIESHEAYPAILDGSLFPDREVDTNW